MQAYLFVHFRERRTPDGEQVYFGLSRDGFHWETVNDAQPVLWSRLGEKGVRDCTIIRCESDGKYRILATDLSLAYNFRNKYHLDWSAVSHNGSKCLSMWESEDLVHWSAQQLVPLGDENFGCFWAPDVLYDPERRDYVLHWSSTHASNGFGNMGIWFSRTKDFKTFERPKPLYQKDDAQQNEKTCDIIGEAELGRPHHRLKRPDGTGAGGRRAGIAVQSRHADGLSRPLIQSALEEIRQVEIGQQRRPCLDPAPET